MKSLVISDIHGSFAYASMIPDIMKSESAERLILLGDLYYHGPRNPLTENYDPMKVSQLLNQYKDIITWIRGNCDAEVDEMISEFKVSEHLLIEHANKKIFLTHGHKYNIDNYPNEDFDIMMYGHFHTHFIKKQDNKIFVNPGSITLPKNGTAHSYAIMDDNEILIKSVDGTVIDKLSI